MIPDITILIDMECPACGGPAHGDYDTPVHCDSCGWERPAEEHAMMQHRLREICEAEVERGGLD